MAVPLDHLQQRSQLNPLSTGSQNNVEVLDPNRPWYDKLVDYLVGDTPEELKSLICENCGRNNGFVPRDEMATIRKIIISIFC